MVSAGWNKRLIEIYITGGLQKQTLRVFFAGRNVQASQKKEQPILSSQYVRTNTNFPDSHFALSRKCEAVPCIRRCYVW